VSKHAAINSRVINIQVMVLLITMSKKDLTKELMGKMYLTGVKCSENYSFLKKNAC